MGCCSLKGTRRVGHDGAPRGVEGTQPLPGDRLLDTWFQKLRIWLGSSSVGATRLLRQVESSGRACDGLLSAISNGRSRIEPGSACSQPFHQESCFIQFGAVLPEWAPCEPGWSEGGQAGSS